MSADVIAILSLGLVGDIDAVGPVGSIADSIIARFNADPWLSDPANVAGGISFHEAVEENPAYPYVQFSLSVNYDHHADGQVQDWRLQFSAFSDDQDSAEVDGILDKLVTCFNGVALSVTGLTNSIAPAVEFRDSFKDEDRRWQGVLVLLLTME